MAWGEAPETRWCRRRAGTGDVGGVDESEMGLNHRKRRNLDRNRSRAHRKNCWKRRRMTVSLENHIFLR